MELKKARQLAEGLLVSFGLLDWKFEFDNAKKQFGLCRHSKHIIRMSRKLVALNNEKEVSKTILHEIAHALVGAGHGHGIVWKDKVISIGGVPERCYSRKVKQPKK
jgi:predicted SprT family Zn-dependent metalloprotease